MNHLVLEVFLILGAFGIGCWLGEREANRKLRDHRQPFRYLRP